MRSHSDFEKGNKLNITQELALTLYLGVYKLIIKDLQPFMGIAELDEVTVSNTIRVLLSGDILIDITKGIKPNTPRASIRSYIATAALADKRILHKHLVDIVRDSRTPRYFVGFRSRILTTLIRDLGKKKWGLGAISITPTIVTGDMGEQDVIGLPKIYLRLRN